MTVKDTLTFNEEIDVAVDLIVLAVGMEPGDITDLVDKMKLPVGADRFLLEVHPKLRPVEVANNGILLAGTCQAPMDVGEACNAAQAAAAKASILLSKGYVELDPFVAEVDLQRCCGQGLCVAECPIEGAIRMVEMQVDGQPLNTRPGQPGPVYRLRHVRRRLPAQCHRCQGLGVERIRRHGGCHCGGLTMPILPRGDHD